MLTFVALLTSAAPAVDVYAFAAAQASFAPDAASHGIIFVGARFADVAGGELDLWMNTDTLHGRLGSLQLSPALVAGVQLDGEALYAGVLPDYYQRGIRDSTRGFYASYVAASGDLTLHFGRQSLREALTGRQWLFGRNSRTDGDFRLPDNTSVIEERLSYTYWALADDLSMYDWHRTTQRLHGLAFGVDLGLDGRTRVSAWGAPDDARNRPSRVIVRARQWLMAGVTLGERVRLQLREWAGTGVHEDDLSRTRVGGTNPYAIPIAGTPWPAFIAATYAAAELSLPVRLCDTVEAGPLLDMAALVDRDRVNSRRVGAVAGFGGFVDVPIGTWQIDMRAGWSPGRWQSRQPQAAAFVAVGHMF